MSVALAMMHDCLFLLIQPWRSLWLRGDAEFDWDDTAKHGRQPDTDA